MNVAIEIIDNRFGTILAHLNDIIGYDWENMEEHLEWLQSASLDEIESWAESIRAEQEPSRAAKEVTA